MTGFIQNILWNSVSGFVEAGTRSAGEFAGNALIKVGDSIENGGRSVGNGIERKATGYGTSISGQTYQPSPKALPSTARKPVVKRSNSLPASNKPTTSGAVSRAPLNKYPGKNQVQGAPVAAKKTVAGGVNTARSTVGGVTNSAPKALSGITNSTPKAIGGIVGGGSKALTGAVPSFKGPSASPAPTKPYPNTNSLPKPYGSNAFPSDKKAAVRPGQPRPFVPPAVQNKLPEKKAYPGTNTLPGQGSRTPVTQQRAKPVPRLGPQVGTGQKMQHIAV